MKFLINTLIILLCLVISGLLNTSYQTVIRLRSLQDKTACCCSEATVCSCSCTGGCCSPIITGVSYTDCDMNDTRTIPSASFEFVTSLRHKIFVFPNKLSYMIELRQKKSVNYILPIDKPPQKSL